MAVDRDGSVPRIVSQSKYHCRWLRTFLRSLWAPLLILCVLSSCQQGNPRDDGPTVINWQNRTNRDESAASQGVKIPDDAVLAKLNGEAVTAGQFREFLDDARVPGYRPATPSETRRLLRALLRERLLDQEVVHRGLKETPEGRDRTLAALIDEYGNAIQVTDADISDYFERHRAEFTAAGITDVEAAGQTIRTRLETRGAQSKKQLVLDYLLGRASVAMDDEQIARLTTGANQAGHQLPPAPPEMAARSDLEHVGTNRPLSESGTP